MGLSKAGFRSWLAAFSQRHSIAVSVVSGLIYALSALLIALASPLSDKVDMRQLWWGVACFAVAAGLGVLREWAQQWVDRGQVVAAAQFRTAVKDALRPVATLIAQMQTMRRGAGRSQRLDVVATQVVGSMQLLLTDVEGLRTVIYKLSGPDRLTPIAALGRDEEPAREFVRHPAGEPDPAFEALENNRSQLVPDIRVEKAQGRRQHGVNHGYLTYISVPIVVGHTGYGMLTLDAPEPDSFTDTDLKLCEFVAELLGIAFVSADPTPQRDESQRSGS